MDYKVMLDSLGKKSGTPVENWKEVNNHYFELEKTHGIKQPYQFVLDMLSYKENLFFVDDNNDATEPCLPASFNSAIVFCGLVFAI